MCREDLRIGRKKFTRVSRVTLATGAATLVSPAARNKVHITVASGSLDVGAVYPTELGSGTGGIGVGGNRVTAEIDIETHGDVVAASWSGEGVGADCPVMVIETFFDDGVFP